MIMWLFVQLKNVKLSIEISSFNKKKCKLVFTFILWPWMKYEYKSKTENSQMAEKNTHNAHYNFEIRFVA